MGGRKNIYYWKSDRLFASGNTRKTDTAALDEIGMQVTEYLTVHFRKDPTTVIPAHGQGNHITFIAKYVDGDYFVRLENGPEGDNYMAIESHRSEERRVGKECVSTGRSRGWRDH